MLLPLIIFPIFPPNSPDNPFFPLLDSLGDLERYRTIYRRVRRRRKTNLEKRRPLLAQSPAR